MSGREFVISSGKCTGRADGGGAASRPARLMSLDECEQYATAVGKYFIGSNVEPNEFPGCVIWENARIEYNEHTDERRGCNLGDTGRCVCTS